MTWEELEKIEAYLKENGYRKTGYKDRQGDYYWWKCFCKGKNPYDDDKSLYCVELNVFDWRKYWHRDADLEKQNMAASMTVTIYVSRTTEEVPIYFEYDPKEIILKDIEDKAYKFFKYVDENFGAPPKEEE